MDDRWRHERDHAQHRRRTGARTRSRTAARQTGERSGGAAMSGVRVSGAERAELQHTARRVLAQQAPMERVRELLDDRLGYDATLFAALAELGWTGMHLPESAGGSGVAFADAAAVIAELGRALTAGP